MEAFYYDGDLNDLSSNTDQEIYIEKIKKFLKNGGNIDVKINGVYPDHAPGTILIYSVFLAFEDVLKFALQNGADISKEIKVIPGRFRFNFENYYRYRYWNALELSILQYLVKPQMFNRIFEIIKEKSLEKFSIHGLHEIHIASALGDLTEVQKYSQHEIINKSIDANSKLWPGVTPLLLAAKFNHPNVVKHLLDVGAVPNVRDSRKNTPLHYLSHADFCDKRLFIYENEDTYGSVNGMSHFHIACKYCPETLDVVRKYLEMGVSPNAQVKNHHEYYQGDRDTFGYTGGFTGLHIAAFSINNSTTANPIELAKLLLEYGIDIDRKSYSGNTTLNLLMNLHASQLENHTVFVCFLVENGAKLDHSIKKLITTIRHNHFAKLIYLCCIKRMLMLNPSSVSSELRFSYNVLSLDARGFNELAYGENCLVEINELDKYEFRRLFDDNMIIKRNYKLKFGNFINSTDICQRYPIYGRTLEIKLKRRLVQFEAKKKRIDEAVPLVTRLFTKFCNLPVICAEEVLWNFSNEQLEKFIKMFTK